MGNNIPVWVWEFKEELRKLAPKGNETKMLQGCKTILKRTKQKMKIAIGLKE